MTGVQTRTPAEELRDAATKIRETAAKACDGPWENAEGVLWIGGATWGYAVPKSEFLPNGADPAWIALMHPGLAEPLAEWLEHEAYLVEKRDLSAEGNTFHALKVARAINGTAS